jgi:hypothetical protein
MINLLIAGFTGAALAVIGAAFYNHHMYQLGRRADLTMDVVSWIDDIYDRLITIHAQREATFTGAKFGLSNDEYRQVVKETKAMLLASKTHAKVALVYGEGRELDKFDTLKEEFVSIAELLLQADKDTWEEANKQINYKFSKIIEPLMNSTERNFLLGSKSEAIAADFIKKNLPALYLPAQDGKGIVVRSPKDEPRPGIGRFVASQAQKFWEAFLLLIRVLIIIAIIGFIAWIYRGKPDLYKAYRDAMNPPAQTEPGPSFESYLPSPDDHWPDRTNQQDDI